MTSKSSWKVEAIVHDPEAEEQLDWIHCNPGPRMRGWLGDKFGPCIGGPFARAITILQVTHLPSARALQARISKDRRRYLAKYKGELLTLETATKMMKEDLLHGR